MKVKPASPWLHKWVKPSLLGLIALACFAVLTIGPLMNSYWPTLPPLCPDAQYAPCIANIAENSALTLGNSEDNYQIAINLALVGKFDAARHVADGLKNPMFKELAESSIITLSVTSAARAHPEKIAPLDEIERLTSAFSSKESKLISAYYIVALDLAGTRPHDISQISLVRDAINRKHPRSKLKIATLEAVLQRLNQLVEKIPIAQRRGAYTNVGNALAAAGQIDKARFAFAKAAEASSSEIQDIELVRAWLKIGAFPEAGAIAKQIGGRYRASILGEVADVLIKEGRTNEAREFLNLAWQAAVSEIGEFGSVDTHRQLLNMTLRSEDRPRALAQSEEMLLLAKKVKLLPEFAFARTAAAFNDVGESARAKKILDQVLQMIPPPEKVVGYGLNTGPVSYGKFKGVADDLYSALAVEYYRVGESTGALDLLTKVNSAWRRNQVWEEILPYGLDCTRMVQDVQGLAGQAGKKSRYELFVIASAACLLRGEVAQATAAIELALLEKPASDPEIRYAYSLDLARLADAVRRTDFVRAALTHAIADAFALNDQRIRSLRLSNAAALATELLRDVN